MSYNPYGSVLIMAHATLTPSAADPLKAIIKAKSIKQGHFVLASGKTSHYYIDCRKTTLDGQGLRLICERLWPLLDALNVDAVGGMTLGADPIVSGLIQYSAQWGRPLQGFLVRKAAKAHGMANQIEGNLEPHMRIALVTTGSSTQQAYQAVMQAFPQVTVAGILAVVDRQAGGPQAFAQMGLSMQALYTVDQLL
jgi:orotate phosphoribosyltransferase